MAEGLSASEVGKEIGEHGTRAAETDGGDRRDRTLSVIEAKLLSLVAVLAAYLVRGPGVVAGARDRAALR